MVAFVEYVYLGSVDNLDEFALELLKLAKKYDVVELKVSLFFDTLYKTRF
jgi:hypothetical protein